MENMQVFVLDVFCSGSATGNPAAVCVLTAWPEDLMLQIFAAAQSAPAGSRSGPPRARLAILSPTRDNPTNAIQGNGS